MGKPAIVIFLLIATLSTSAQRRIRSKYEWVYGVGASAFLGELGGADREGSNFVRDYEASTTRSVLALGLRRRLSRFSFAKANVFYGYVNGSDVLTDEYFRNKRNLSFRSPIFELSGQYEFSLIKERQGALYKIKNARGKKNNIQVYAFGGGGVFFFNPQTKYLGSWVNLQPLGTEGQGLPGMPKKYSRINFALLYGGGLKYGIDRKTSIGVELGFRKTFTDYIDDVSTDYYPDMAEFRSLKGDLAADLADRSDGQTFSQPDGDGSGAQRGQPKNKDFYGFMTVSVNYKMLYKRKTRSKF